MFQTQTGRPASGGTAAVPGQAPAFFITPEQKKRAPVRASVSQTVLPIRRNPVDQDREYDKNGMNRVTT